VGAILRFAPDHDDHAGCHARLLPGRRSRAIGSDSQRPFALVSVGAMTRRCSQHLFVAEQCTYGIDRDTDQLPLADDETKKRKEQKTSEK